MWRGTATRRTDIHVQLYCDDPKAAELALIDQGVRYDVQVARDAQGRAYDVLSIHSLCRPLGEYVGVHLSVRDYRARHGSLLADSRGRTTQGGVDALRKLMENHGDQ